MEKPIFYVSISPHIRDVDTVPRIMWTVFIVLLPQLFLATWVFGPRVLLVALVSILSCVVVEAISQRLLGRPVTIKDGSAALTGLLLAYVLPPGVPISLPLWGSVMAIFVAKQLMGGLGYNIFNPALVARAFLAAGFPVAMTTTWLEPFAWRNQADAISSATPLYLLKHYGPEALSGRFGGYENLLKNFFFGLQSGSIGETSAALLLAGGVFLIYRRIITWHIPVATLATVALLSWIFGGEGLFKGDPLVHLLSGGIILGAFFMATDYVTSPSLPLSRIIFGVGVGALTVLIRLRGGYPEGVCYAILLMNCFVPALNEWIRPKRFAPPKVRT